MTDPNTPTEQPQDEGDEPREPEAAAVESTETVETPPRAFAQGTGLMLQFVGVMLFLTTCCVCSSAWVWDPIFTSGEMEKQVTEDGTQPIPTLSTMFQDPATAGFSLMVAFSTVGGLAMAVFGLGLQADKPRSAVGALVTVCLWVLVLLGTGICLWIGDGSIAARLWNFLMFVGACVLVGFVVAALKQVRENPPPAGMDILPSDWEPPKRMRH